jgi:hypothetical protein
MPDCLTEFEAMKIRSAYKVLIAPRPRVLTRGGAEAQGGALSHLLTPAALLLAQFMIFKISDDKKNIMIEHKGEKGASFDDFCSKLPDGDCRYAVLDVEIDTKSGATANKLIFVAWCAWHVRSRAIGGGPGAGSGREGAGGQQVAALCPRAYVAALRSRRCALLCRSDDNAPVRPKMLYASSKDALKKALTGINDEYQATESAS